MAQHLEQQASKLPTLLVHPKSVFLLVYPGGHCGEFLAWWLGQHPGCVRTPIMGIENNRYIWQPSYNFEYSEHGTRDRVYLTAHPGSTVSKPGFNVPDLSQHIRLYSSQQYLQFFYCLFLIKTIFFEYDIENHRPPSFFNSENWLEFLKYLGPRKKFYFYEADQWLNQCHTDVRNYLEKRWNSLGSPKPIFKPSFDVGKLFFENTEQEIQTLLAELNIPFSSKIFYYLPEYHQRNVALVEKYFNIKIDQFLELNADQVLDLVVSRYS